MCGSCLQFYNKLVGYILTLKRRKTTDGATGDGLILRVVSGDKDDFIATMVFDVKAPTSFGIINQLVSKEVKGSVNIISDDDETLMYGDMNISDVDDTSMDSR